MWLMCTITLFVVYGLTIFLHNLMRWTTCSFTITMVRGNVVYIGLLHASKQDAVHIEESSKGKRPLVFALIKKQIVCKVSVRWNLYPSKLILSIFFSGLMKEESWIAIKTFIFVVKLSIEFEFYITMNKRNSLYGIWGCRFLSFKF